MKWEILQQHEGMTIYDFLYDELNFSNRLIKKAKSEGNFILVNGTKRTVRYILQCGDVLHVKFAPEKKGLFMTATHLPLSFVYEDEHVIVIDKQPYVTTIPSRLHPTHTVANGLIYYYEKNNLPYTAHIITRLDRNTSGLLLVAKHQYSHSLLSNIQREGQIKRKYKAIVHGHLYKKSGEINVPIGRKDGSIIERTVRKDGQFASTLYEVEREIGPYSLVNIQLKTGRTHQIRVHFSYLGHPLVGDELYGGDVTILKRQALHCETLSFIHPFSKEEVTMTSELHNDLQMFIRNVEDNKI